MKRENNNNDDEHDKQALLCILEQLGIIVNALNSLSQRVKLLDSAAAFRASQELIEKTAKATISQLGLTPVEHRTPTGCWATQACRLLERYLDPADDSRRRMHSYLAGMIDDGSLTIDDGYIVLRRGHVEEFLKRFVDCMSAEKRRACRQAYRQRPGKRHCAMTLLGEFLAERLMVRTGAETAPAKLRSLTAQLNRTMNG